MTDAAEPRITWCSDRSAVEQVISNAIAQDSIVRERLAPLSTCPGHCVACGQDVRFRVSENVALDGWPNLMEGMICPVCHTNGRMRLAMIAFRQLWGKPAQPVKQRFRPYGRAWRILWRLRRICGAIASSRRSIVLERVTPVFHLLSMEEPTLIGCEYLGASHEPGRRYRYRSARVRHEDMMALSAANNHFDLLMHFDVLEHVPRLDRALAECARVLKPGGEMLFTIPFYPANDRHVVRAVARGDGPPEHVLPEAYHRNPVGAGALVYREPGWEILEDLERAGFRTEVGFLYDLDLGIVSNGCPWQAGFVWPLIFRARKN